MLRRIMVASYFLGLVVMVFAAAIKVADVAGRDFGIQAANWGVGACALFLSALASAGMMETGKK
jgi:hypothetical protein